MPKFVLTIETTDVTELAAVMSALEGVAASTSTFSMTTGEGAKFPDDENTSDTPPPKAARGRPKKAAPVSPPPGSNGADAQLSPTHAALLASIEATDPAKETLPTLEALKHAVTTAVRLAQKGEGDPKILTFLPGFKTKTGLDFVMNAGEDHRAALYELASQAGLTLA